MVAKETKAQRSRDRYAQRYGGPICVCCGESVYEFLTIDHVDESGGVHRKSINNKCIYSWLKQHDYPSGFQVLCSNCQNRSKPICGGICPHKLKLFDPTQLSLPGFE